MGIVTDDEFNILRRLASWATSGYRRRRTTKAAAPATTETTEAAENPTAAAAPMTTETTETPAADGEAEEHEPIAAQDAIDGEMYVMLGAIFFLFSFAG